MVRKPAPRDAAARVLSYLRNHQNAPSMRDALNIVALVEGHNSWQSMRPVVESARHAPAAKATSTAYEKCWLGVRDSVMNRMNQLCALLVSDVREDIKVHGPLESSEDESRIEFWLTPKSDDTQVYCLATFRLLEADEDSDKGVTGFALQLRIENPLTGAEIYGWAAGSPFSGNWAQGAPELCEVLEFSFNNFEALKFVSASKHARHFMP